MQPESEIENEAALIDAIEGAIDDSIDMDWRPIDGARAVAKALIGAGAVRFAEKEPTT